MYTVRPIRRADLAALTTLWLRSRHSRTPPRMPATAAALECLFEQLLALPQSDAARPGRAMYGMVLSADANDEVLGCVVLAARAGCDGAYYAFRRDLLRQGAPHPIRVDELPTLTLCAGLTRHADLLRHYMAPDVDDEAHALLLHACVLFAASTATRFAPSCLIALPGPQEPAETPFWDAIGARFFKSKLDTVERALGHTRTHPCIVKMMPHFPIYVPVLPLEAQLAIGRAGARHAPMALSLTEYGFVHDRYLDLLDGGPIFIASQAALAATLGRRRKTVRIEPDVAPGGRRYLLANRCPHDFRATLGAGAQLSGDTALALDAGLAERLRVGAGDDLVCLPA
jgi:arginine N-succinyltransferase